MNQFLDLREKVEPEVKVVYKTVTKSPSWYVELVKTLAVIAIVTTAVWGISRADDLAPKKSPISRQTTFGVMGLVSEITPTSISLGELIGGDVSELTSSTFDPTTADRIETSDYVPLLVSDIKTGDKIIIQWVLDDGVAKTSRIVSFTSTPNIATTTDEFATTTPEIATTTTATTTDELATSTSTATTDEIASSTSTTTPSIVDEVYDVVADTTQNVIDVITDIFIGTTTAESAIVPEVIPTPEPEILPNEP